MFKAVLHDHKGSEDQRHGQAAILSSAKQIIAENLQWNAKTTYFFERLFIVSENVYLIWSRVLFRDRTMRNKYILHKDSHTV